MVQKDKLSLSHPQIQYDSCGGANYGDRWPVLAFWYFLFITLYPAHILRGTDMIKPGVFLSCFVFNINEIWKEINRHRVKAIQ